MRRRKIQYRPIRPTRPQEPKQPVNPCREMVLIDGTNIRKKVKKAYEKALRDLDNSRRKLDHFNQKDVPLYTSWLSSHFGPLLTEGRELHQQITADEMLISIVEAEAILGGISCAEAYERVMKLRDNPEPPPSATDEDAQNRERNPFEDPIDGSDDDGGEEDPLEAFFRAMFGDDLPEEDPWEKKESDTRSRVESTPTSPAHGRLKDLYRAVVRRLHPDRQSELTAQKTEWWHQAQAAYEAGDVEQLEVILTLYDIGETGTTEQTSASLLQRITDQLKSSLNEIKRQLTKKRRDPAWNFSTRNDHDALAEKLRESLMADLRVLRFQSEQTKTIINRWKATLERRNSKSSRKPRRQRSKFPL